MYKQPKYTALLFTLENLTTSVLLLDDKGLELFDLKLLQAREKIAAELRKRKAKQDG